MVLLGACGNRAETAPPSPAPSPEVISALGRGVNLSTWFTDRGAPDIDPNLWYIDQGDFALISRTGLKHVRIPIDPVFFQDPKAENGLNNSAIEELKTGLRQAKQAGLLSIVALQPTHESKLALANGDKEVRALANFWRQLALALKEFPANALVFEALNEPELEDPSRSRAVMEQLVAAIRTVAPKHTVVVAGHKFSGAEELMKMVPLADRNVVYAFHFYDPHNFTHQGANWGWDMWKKFVGWPYPSSPEAVAKPLETAEPEAKEHLAWFGEQRWDRGKLGLILDKAGTWAFKHQTIVWCNEFGSTREVTSEAARRAWLTDVRELLEARRIPWSHWDYSGHFGMVRGLRGERTLDPAAAAALELKPLP